MRFIYLANNRVGLEIVRWLVEFGTPPSALVMHPSSRARYREEIIDAAGLPRDRIFDGSTLQDSGALAVLKALELEMGLSVLFDYILRDRFLALLPRGCLNLHPGYLPYNRGQYPNVWSIVEGTPSGVTLHFIDSGIDTGDIVAQREVEVQPTDTGESLYRRLERACVELFQDTWPHFLAGRTNRIPQDRSAGTYHRTRDVEQIDRIDLDGTYRAGTLIDILRARTFPPYRGAYFLHQGRRVYLHLHLQMGQPGEEDQP